PRPDLGRDRSEAQRQFFDRRVAERSGQLLGEAAAAKQAGAAKTDVEIGEHAAAREAAAPLLDIVELARRIAAADDRAEGSAGDDVGRVSFGDQRVDDADMRKTARR